MQTTTRHDEFNRRVALELMEPEPSPAEWAEALADKPTTPTYSAEQRALCAILERRSAYAQQQLAAAVTEKDKDAEKIARNSLNAYTNAQALILGAGVNYPGRAFLVTPGGALLVRSSTRPNQWHGVSRRPAGGDGYDPIVCSCEHGQRGGFGICQHVAVYEAYDELFLVDEEQAARAILAA